MVCVQNIWLDKETSVMCYMLSARKLSIDWSEVLSLAIAGSLSTIAGSLSLTLGLLSLSRLLAISKVLMQIVSG